jgi:hypothetical protein
MHAMNLHIGPPAVPIRLLVAAAVLIAAALCAGPCAAAAQSAASMPAAVSAGSDDARFTALQQQLAQVQAQLQQLAQENRELRAHQEQIDRELAERSAAALSGPSVSIQPPVPPSAAPLAPVPAASVPAGTAAPAANASALPVPAPQPATAAPAFAEGLRLWGYGESYYTDPTHEGAKAQADLARAVFGIGYSFDERTEFNSEYEVEHAVTSASDVGEFEVEQFYIDRRLSDAVSVRGGLFLMPFGMINEHHEPTNFYGVQRNFIETLIIPSTWREGGFNLHGETRRGLGWSVGLTTGFDLSKWNFTPEFPQYVTALDLENSNVAPLQATHQELALANAHHLSQYLALGYYGIPGLTLGGAISTGDAVKVPAPPNAPIPGGERVTLWETHARWMPAQWDLSALYAHGSISNLALANAANPGSPNPIPSSFYGYFLQGAYRLWEQGDYRAVPFVRWERYNLGASYQGTSGPVIPAGLVPLSATPGDYGYWPLNHDRVWTAGASLYVGQHVVVKGDYQWFQVNEGFKRFDLGLGLNF